ncbi:hypothetical protein D9M70_456670 [compost metagenome]
MVHEDAGGVDAVRGQRLLAQVVDLGDHAVGGHRHQRSEVARAAVVLQVAVVVRAVSGDEGVVGAQRRLDVEPATVDRDRLARLAEFLRHLDVGEEGRQADPGAADALGEQALGDELHLQAAGGEGAPRRAAQPQVGGDHLADGAGLDQPRHAVAVLVRIVLDDQQVALALAGQFLQQGERRARRAEAADHDAAAIGDAGYRLGQ